MIAHDSWCPRDKERNLCEARHTNVTSMGETVTRPWRMATSFLRFLDGGLTRGSCESDIRVRRTQSMVGVAFASKVYTYPRCPLACSITMAKSSAEYAMAFPSPCPTVWLLESLT